MKTIAPVIFLLISMATLVAQESEKSGFIGASFGLSAPIGSYAATEDDVDEPGYARPGIALNTTGGYLFTPNIGLTAMLYLQSHSIDDVAMEAELEDVLPGTNWTVIADKYLTTGAMAGLLLVAPGNGFAFDFRLLSGVAICKSPLLTAQGSGPGGSATVTTDQDTQASFAYDFGIGFQADLTSEVALTINTDLFGTSPNFIHDTHSGSSRTLEVVQQHMGVLNITAGIVIQL